MGASFASRLSVKALASLLDTSVATSSIIMLHIQDRET
jgi:hypothetical protein